MNRNARVAAAAVAIALLLGACGGSSGDSNGAGTTVAGAGSGLQPWDPNRKMNDMTGYSSPLAKALGYDSAQQPDQAAQEAEYRAREQKRQEAVAECMRTEGFEYTPYVPEQMFGGVGFEPPGWDLTRKEYVEKYGFGMSTTFEDSNQPPEPEDMPKPEDDPNYVYTQGLSQTEQEAYNKALYGEQSFEEPVDGGDGTTETTAAAMAFEMAGCFGKAEEALNGGKVTDEDQAFAEDINKRLETFYQQLQADKRVVEANREYATCMSGKGFPEIDKQQAAYEKVSEKMNVIYESMNGPTMTNEDGSTMATIAGAPLPAEGGGGTGAPQVDQAKLAEIKTYELAVAKADLECGLDVARTTYEVSLELEQRFVDENTADLARYKEINERQGGMG
jgi:hypothetical protein